jgi:hypothetical protein
MRVVLPEPEWPTMETTGRMERLLLLGGAERSS